MAKKKYEEGIWFAVPVQPEGYAVGVIARATYSDYIALAYFFGLRYTTIPTLEQIKSLKPSDAVRVLRISDIGIRDGEWPIIGKIPGWNRAEWPIPNFVRKEDLTNRVWLVKYSDDNPNLVLSEELVVDEPISLEKNALRGYKSAEFVLSKSLV